MALIKSVNGVSPKFGNNCYLAENATVVGDVEMGDDCSVWFTAVVRGDVNWIRMGNKVNIQDAIFQNHCTRRNQNVAFNNDIVHHNRAHTHENVAVNRTPV